LFDKNLSAKLHFISHRLVNYLDLVSTMVSISVTTTTTIVAIVYLAATLAQVSSTITSTSIPPPAGDITVGATALHAMCMKECDTRTETDTDVNTVVCVNGKLYSTKCDADCSIFGDQTAKNDCDPVDNVVDPRLLDDHRMFIPTKPPTAPFNVNFKPIPTLNPPNYHVFQDDDDDQLFEDDDYYFNKDLKTTSKSESLTFVESTAGHAVLGAIGVTVCLFVVIFIAKKEWNTPTNEDQQLPQTISLRDLQGVKSNIQLQPSKGNPIVTNYFDSADIFNMKVEANARRVDGNTQLEVTGVRKNNPMFRMTSGVSFQDSSASECVDENDSNCYDLSKLECNHMMLRTSISQSSLDTNTDLSPVVDGDNTLRVVRKLTQMISQPYVEDDHDVIVEQLDQVDKLMAEDPDFKRKLNNEPQSSLGSDSTQLQANPTIVKSPNAPSTDSRSRLADEDTLTGYTTETVESTETTENPIDYAMVDSKISDVSNYAPLGVTNGTYYREEPTVPIYEEIHEPPEEDDGMLADDDTLTGYTTETTENSKFARAQTNNSIASGISLE